MDQSVIDTAREMASLAGKVFVKPEPKFGLPAEIQFAGAFKDRITYPTWNYPTTPPAWSGLSSRFEFTYQVDTYVGGDRSKCIAPVCDKDRDCPGGRRPTQAQIIAACKAQFPEPRIHTIRVFTAGGLPDKARLAAYFKINPDGRLRLDDYEYWVATSQLDFIKSRVLPLALTFAGLGGLLGPLAASIGNAMVPASIAGAYPGVAPVVGNLALSTALSGGDIEAAVRQSFASLVGAQMGGSIGAVVDSQAAGVAAAAATRAALLGGDIQYAVIASLVPMGLQATGDYLSEIVAPPPAPVSLPEPELQPLDLPTGENMDFNDFNFDFDSFDPTAAVDPFAGVFGNTGASNDYMFGFQPDLGGDAWSFDQSNMMPADTVVLNTISDPGYAFGGDTYASGGLTDVFGGWQVPENVFGSWDFGQPNPTLPPVGPSSGYVFDGASNEQPTDYGAILRGLTSAAVAAVQLVRAYKGQPVVTGTAQAQQGAQANPNGTVTVTNASGQRRTTMPTVGTPYQLSDGSVIINNGDGTYTVVDSLGRRTVKRYASSGTGLQIPGSVGGVSTQTLALAAGAGLIAYLATRKR